MHEHGIQDGAQSRDQIALTMPAFPVVCSTFSTAAMVGGATWSPAQRITAYA